MAVVYDRRNLDYDNIDPHLYQKMKLFLFDMRKWYGCWVGAFYVVHVNWMLWFLYLCLLKPILACCLGGGERQLIVLREANDILAYINADQLPAGFFDRVGPKSEKKTEKRGQEENYDDEEDTIGFLSSRQPYRI